MLETTDGLKVWIWDILDKQTEYISHLEPNWVIIDWGIWIPAIIKSSIFFYRRIIGIHICPNEWIHMIVSMIIPNDIQQNIKHSLSPHILMVNLLIHPIPGVSLVLFFDPTLVPLWNNIEAHANSGMTNAQLRQMSKLSDECCIWAILIKVQILLQQLDKKLGLGVDFRYSSMYIPFVLC